MVIRYVHGDLLDAHERLLVHGCNAQGVMGSGFAKAVRERHPAAYRAYRVAHQRSGLRLGDVVWATSGTVAIGNMITQQNYGRDPNVVYCDYAAIQTAMRRVDERAAELSCASVGLPQVGAGLAHGDWGVIAAIIEEEARCFTPVVYILDEAIFAALNKAA